MVLAVSVDDIGDQELSKQLPRGPDNHINMRILHSGQLQALLLLLFKGGFKISSGTV